VPCLGIALTLERGDCVGVAAELCFLVTCFVRSEYLVKNYLLRSQGRHETAKIVVANSLSLVLGLIAHDV